MTMHGLKRTIAPLQVLSPADVELIREGTLHVLEHTGVAFHHERALDVLAEAGCLVDRDAQRVRFPAEVVEAALASVPRAGTSRARLHENDLVWGARDETFLMTGGGMQLVDLQTGQPRQPSRKEFYDLMRLFDALPTVHTLNAFPLFGFTGVPQAMALVESCAAKIRMSGKAQAEGSVLGNDRFTLAMGAAVEMDLGCIVNSVSPLCYDRDAVDKLLYYTDQDAQFGVAAGPLAGTSAPASLAGAMVLNNAEIIGGLVLAQVLRPGSVSLPGSMLLMQNMRSGGPFFGSIANGLAAAACIQLWREYDLTYGVVTPAFSDSKMLDYQAGTDVASAAMLCCLAGASDIVWHGGISQQMTAHPVKAVLDDELATSLGRVLRGVDVDEDSLALDLIDQVGPAPGSYLGNSHTRAWYKKEAVIPPSADLTPFAGWVEAPPVGILEHAQARIDEILATHTPTPLSDSQEAAIEAILQEARQYYRSRDLISDAEWSAYEQDLASPEYPYA